jgi:chlorophyll(ide) b reductase
MKSLTREAEQLDSPVGVHTLSPGMCLTDLLLENATNQNKQVFNILCEQPETVAAFLVPRVRTVAARGTRVSYIKYLTVQRALLCFLSSPLRAGRYFDVDGTPVSGRS